MRCVGLIAAAREAEGTEEAGWKALQSLSWRRASLRNPPFSQAKRHSTAALATGWVGWQKR
jgi:hypothetical protein